MRRFHAEPCSSPTVQHMCSFMATDSVLALRPRARCSYSRPGCGQKQKFRTSSASRYCAVAPSPPRK